VRFVYIDEAGTSDEEPVAVVVGMIAHADQQVMLAEAAVREVLEAVPPEFKEGFWFHAKEVWGAEKYKERWRMTDRLDLLHNMMRLPRRLDMAISFGMVRKTAPLIPPLMEKGMNEAQVRHYMAFLYCIATADRWIRDNAEVSEVATAVAEDVPEMRRFIKDMPRRLRVNPIISQKDWHAPNQADTQAGFINQFGDLRVSRIRNVVHFVEKGDDPLLQLADACAFGLRRYFSEQSFGDDFLLSILGKPLIKSDFAGPANWSTFGAPRKP
jgi:hypothetical protein